LTQSSKEDTPLVSVVVPAYNVERYIDECLKSIFGQTYKNIEVIVVYTASEDGTYQMLHKYLDRIKLVKTERRLPISRIRNLGVRKAIGDYTAFCDADDYWHLKKLERQIETHLSNYGAGLTYTDVITISENAQEVSRTRSQEWEFRRFLDGHFITFSSVVVETKLIKEAGLFDERIQFAEDFDLLIRLGRLTNFKRVAGFYTYHRIRSGTLTKSISKLQYLLILASVFSKYNMTKRSIKCYLKHNMIKLSIECHSKHNRLLVVHCLGRLLPQNIKTELKKILKL